jgi:RNA polymerase sigma-B factor
MVKVQTAPMIGAAISRSECRRRTSVALRLAQGAPATRQHYLNEAIGLNLPFANAIAHRFHDRGVRSEDIDQVALLGLTKAAHCYDPGKGDFMPFAMVTIAGEVKRYFRDAAWMVRPPRRIQGLQAQMSPVIQELTQTLGRAPRPSEVAAHIGSVEEVVEALACRGCFAPASLDDCGPDHTFPMIERLGEEEPGYARVEALAMLSQAVRELKPRDKLIVRLRFFEEYTQKQISEELDLSQAQVSRLLRRIMKTLRGRIEPSRSATAA